MKKIIASLIVAAVGWVMTANAQMFGVGFGRPGISVAVAAPVPSVYYAPRAVYVPAPVYSVPAAPYYPSPYYYGGYSYGYGPSVTTAPYWGWGWGGRWGRGGGWRGGGGGMVAEDFTADSAAGFMGDLTDAVKTSARLET